MNTNKNNIVKYTIFIALSGFFLFVDLLTKFIAQATLEGKKPLVLIDGVLELLFIRNEGAAWGMFSGAGIIFSIIAIAAMIIMIYVLVRMPATKHYGMLLATIICLFTGALGNLIDRLWLSYVRDFIYFYGIDFPVFNMADIFVTVGAVLLIISLIFVYKEKDYAFLKIKKR